MTAESLSVAMVTVDCADPDGLAAWWCTAVGGEVHPAAPGEFVVLVRANGPRLGFQRVDHPTPGKNRVHVDFVSSDPEAEADRLIALGAIETSRNGAEPNPRWVVLEDPAGNAFCVGAE